MKSIIRGIAFFALAFLITACSVLKHGPVPLAEASRSQAAKTFIVPEGKANIYVAYVGGYSSSFRNFSITINGNLKGFLSDSTFMQVALDPGHYTIVSSSPENQQFLEIDVVAGRNYFFSMNSELGIMNLRVKLVPVSDSEGKAAVLERDMVK